MKYITYTFLLSTLFIAAGCGAADTSSTNDRSTVPTNTANTNATSNINSPSSANENIEQATSDSYTLDEVAQHASRTDCWLAIEGAVYDVTSYIGTHPGGAQILQGCGKDATTLFQTQGGQGSHSGSARSMLSQYQIGILAE